MIKMFKNDDKHDPYVFLLYYTTQFQSSTHHIKTTHIDKPVQFTYEQPVECYVKRTAT